MDKHERSTREEVDLIYHELKKTNKLLKQFTSFRLSFARGVASGFGAFLGATIVITIVIWFLSQLQFVPIVGGFATQVVDFVKLNTEYQNGEPRINNVLE